MPSFFRFFNYWVWDERFLLVVSTNRRCYVVVSPLVGLTCNLHALNGVLCRELGASMKVLSRTSLDARLAIDETQVKLARKLGLLRLQKLARMMAQEFWACAHGNEAS